jgi:hypothetical protein
MPKCRHAKRGFVIDTARGVVCLDCNDALVSESLLDAALAESARLREELDEATAILLNLRTKMKKVDPLLASDRVMGFIHGSHWPEGDENNWKVEVEDADAFLRRREPATAKP